MRILCIGDIFGRPGRTGIKKTLPKLKSDRKIDFVVANGENLASGLGMTYDTYKEMIDAGVDYFTSGNHIWKKKDFIGFLDKKEIKVLRPLNYPKTAPGRGIATLNLGKNKISIISLMGKAFMADLVDYTDNPFYVINEELKKIKSKIIIVDFHAEATSEKKAMGYYLDGRVSCIFGTHTHIPTADYEITKKGTAYITDIGMVGVKESSIGLDFEQIIERYRTAVPIRSDVALKGEQIFNAIIVDIDNTTGKAKSIELINEIVE